MRKKMWKLKNNKKEHLKKNYKIREMKYHCVLASTLHIVSEKISEFQAQQQKNSEWKRREKKT